MSTSSILEWFFAFGNASIEIAFEFGDKAIQFGDFLIDWVGYFLI